MPHSNLLGRDALSRGALVAFVLYVLVLPLSGTAALRSLAFVALILLTVIAVLRRRLTVGLPLAVPWAAYALVSVLSLLYAVDANYSFGEVKAEVLYGYLIFAMAWVWVRDERDLSTIAILLAGGNLVFVIGSLVTVQRIGFLNSGTGAWSTGVGATSTVVVTVLPWLGSLAWHCWREDRRLPAAGLLLLVLLNLAALFLTMNRQGWLAIAFAALIAVVLFGRHCWTPRRLILACFSSLLFVGLVSLQFTQRHRAMTPPAEAATASSVGAIDEDIAHLALAQRDVRWELWRFSLERIIESPLTGGGFGRRAFDLQFRDYHLQSGHALWHAHNMVINKGIQMGVPGIVAFLALWASMAHAAWRIRRDQPQLRPWAIACLAMMSGVFVKSMTDDFFIRDHALLFWLLCGALLGAAREPTTREVA